MMSYVARASIGRPIMMELRSLTCNYSCVSPKLTYEASYLARLCYVHKNAVKHGIVRIANQYRPPGLRK